MGDPDDRLLLGVDLLVLRLRFLDQSWKIRGHGAFILTEGYSYRNVMGDPNDYGS